MSLVNNLAAGTVLLSFESNQARLSTTVSRLSSGLRINSAADDPSGLAISQTLQAQVNGFDQGFANVQTATNALTVADGALATVTDLLQRVRSLAVEAATDTSSNADRSDLQTELDALLLEINRIAQNATFNGIALLDGSHAGFQGSVFASVAITANAALASVAVSSPTSMVATPDIVNGDLASPGLPNNSAGGPPTGWTFGGLAELLHGTIDTPPDPIPSNGNQVIRMGFGQSASQTVASLSAGTYTLTFQAASWQTTSPAQPLDVSVNGSLVNTVTLPPGAGYATYSTTFAVASTGPVTLKVLAPAVGGQAAFVTDFSLSSVSSSQVVGSGPSVLIASAVAANASFQTTGPGTAGLGGIGTTDGTIEVQVINTGTSIAAQETFIDTASGFVSVSGTLLAPNSTTTLFDNVAVTLGNFTSPDVGASSFIKVQQAAAASDDGTPLYVQAGADEGATIGVALAAVSTNVLRVANVDFSTFLGAEDAVGQVDAALRTVLLQRADLGALVVRLGETAQDDDVASTNLRAAASSISDANVGEETVAFVRDQVISSIDLSTLAQLNVRSGDVLKLFQSP